VQFKVPVARRAERRLITDLIYRSNRRSGMGRGHRSLSRGGAHQGGAEPVVEIPVPWPVTRTRQGNRRQNRAWILPKSSLP